MYGFRERAMSIDDAAVMQTALLEASQSQRRGDRGVGAVLVFPGGKMFSEGDTVHSDHDPLAHAEIKVVRKALESMGSLRNAVLYSTCEPCPMCATALAEAGVKELIFGAYNEAHGFYSSKIFRNEMLPLIFKGGVLAEECIECLNSKLAETAHS